MECMWRSDLGRNELGKEPMSLTVFVKAKVVVSSFFLRQGIQISKRFMPLL